jgi:hypothetical protein
MHEASFHCNYLFFFLGAAVTISNNNNNNNNHKVLPSQNTSHQIRSQLISGSIGRESSERGNLLAPRHHVRRRDLSPE